MTTNNESNAKTYSELATYIEKNGYEGLTNDEINFYMNTKIEIENNTAKAEKEIELLKNTLQEQVNILQEKCKISNDYLEKLCNKNIEI